MQILKSTTIAAIIAAGLSCGMGTPAAAFSYFDELVDPAITASPIEVRIWVKPGVDPADEARVMADIQTGLLLWEDVPTSEIAFAIQSIDYGPAKPAIAPHQLQITVANAADLTSGGATPPMGGSPGEWLGCVADNPSLDIIGVTAHEVGHALGLEHSSITENAFDWDTLPLMLWKANNPALDPDDVAAISYAYPDPALDLWDVSGGISGRLLEVDTGEPVFGVNVVAVNTADGVPHVSRYSGDPDDDGRFLIPGLEEGDYELHFLQGHSIRGSVWLLPFYPWIDFQTDNFTEFTVAAQPVYQGLVRNVGDIYIDIEPMELDGYYQGAAPGIDDPMPLSPLESYLPSAYVNHNYELWLHVAGGLRPLTGQVSGLPQGIGWHVLEDPRGWNNEEGLYGQHWVRISGTPTQPGLYTIDIELEDEMGERGWIVHNLLVEPLPAPTGPIAYLPFEGDTKDYSGNGHDGIFHGGTPTYVDDQWGNPNSALELDGVDDFVELIDEEVFEVAEYTMVAVLEVPHHAQTNYVISKGPNYGNYTLYINEATANYWAGYAAYAHQSQYGNYSSIVSTGPVPTGESFCLAVSVSEAESTTTTYYNGQPVYTFGNMASHRFNDDPVHIGHAEFTHSGDQYFKGAVDEIVILEGLISPWELELYCDGYFNEQYPLNMRGEAREECYDSGEELSYAIDIANRSERESIGRGELRVTLPQDVAFVESSMRGKYDEDTHAFYGKTSGMEPGESLEEWITVDVGRTEDDLTMAFDLDTGELQASDVVTTSACP